MKYSILGFNQQKMLDANLDVIDAFILQHLKDFYSTGKMRTQDINGERMSWVQYASLLEELPTLGLTTKRALRLRMKKLVDKGMLHHATVKAGGTFSYYAFTDAVHGLQAHHKREVL